MIQMKKLQFLLEPTSDWRFSPSLVMKNIQEFVGTLSLRIEHDLLRYPGEILNFLKDNELCILRITVNNVEI